MASTGEEKEEEEEEEEDEDESEISSVQVPIWRRSSLNN